MRVDLLGFHVIVGFVELKVMGLVYALIFVRIAGIISRSWIDGFMVDCRLNPSASIRDVTVEVSLSKVVWRDLCYDLF